MPLIPTTTLLSAHPPIVKAGEVIVPVRTGTGERLGLRGTAALFRGIADSIAAEEQRQIEHMTGRHKTKRAKPVCSGCDNPGCTACVAAVRATVGRTGLPKTPVAKPNGRLL